MQPVPSAIERARRVLPVVSVQNRYNISDRSWEDVPRYCERDALAFIPWFPLGAGALAVSDAVDQMAQRHDVTPLQVALAWLLARACDAADSGHVARLAPRRKHSRGSGAPHGGRPPSAGGVAGGLTSAHSGGCATIGGA
jgi:hypothetical protein